MKGSINQGGVKDGSASLVKALSGAPRCVLSGPISVVYDFDIFYEQAGIIEIHPPSGVGIYNPANVMPFGKWLLTVTSTIFNPIQGTLKLSPAVEVSLSRLHSRYLRTLTSWDAVLLDNSANPELPFIANISGQDGTALGLRMLADWSLSSGPDLFSVCDIDFSNVGQTVTANVLPEQSEACETRFYVYSFASFNNQWQSGSGGLSELKGWQLLSGQPNRYPNHTKLGTIRFQFSRISNTPLFIWSVTPPRTFVFINKTFFNPSLNPVWDWDFGDGSAHSSSANPTHTYAATGKYHVTLRATDATGVTKSFDQYIDITLKAGFIFQKFAVTVGGVPKTRVFFNDRTIGAPLSWNWNFGDGGGSFQQNPSRDYPVGGSFNVSLTVEDALLNSSSITQTVTT